MARTRSRRYQKAAAKVDRNKRYAVVEGVALIKSLTGPKFDEAVDVAVRIGIDAKKTDQLVRGSVSLPKGTGKSVKIAVFAEGEKAKDALAAGADFVGSADLADKIEKGFTDFDMTIASPDMMKYVGKLGKVLGPQGKMPSPKAGTVTTEIGMAVREFKAGKIEFRNDDGGSVAAPMGKRSFTVEKLRENVKAFIDHLAAMRPSTVKGNFMLNASLSASMSPGVRLKV